MDRIGKLLLAMDEDGLFALVSRQLNALLCFDSESEADDLYEGVKLALEKMEYLIPKCKNKYYFRDGKPYFNPFHAGQNTIFIYFLSRIVYAKLSNERLADRIFYLNRVINCINIFYTTELPDIFYLDHAIGTVIGKAVFSNYFQFRQNVTVGNNHGKYPRFGRNVHLWSGASVIGECIIGDNVIVSANTYIKDQDVPSNCLVFGNSPNLIFKQKSKDYFLESQHFVFD